MTILQDVCHTITAGIDAMTACFRGLLLVLFFFSGVALGYFWHALHRVRADLQATDFVICQSNRNLFVFTDTAGQRGLRRADDHSVVLPAVYQSIGENFVSDRTYVKKDDKYGYVDTCGRLITDIDYDAAFPFFEFSYSVAMVKRGQHWGLIDINGIEVVPCQYHSLEYIQDSTGSVVGLIGHSSIGEKWNAISFDIMGRIMIYKDEVKASAVDLLLLNTGADTE